ncbi:hypothetical protein CARUB_v10022454mg [Capsella rubella]|uniref:F-box domain-containing protein n=1 Tax=Capsella rubella TaxID=81985 RepID=R0GG87_9BRAS|nr:putative F-box protein At1g70390 [Capsella rubella]EOA34872.1 hypothetical protein CARUB_v10022454mg [Capsella rubella]
MVYETLPQDLHREILSFLPMKTLARCLCVSRQWESLIRGEDFKDLYLSRSMKRPRLMLVVTPSTYPPEPMVFCFHSVYQEEEPLLSSGQQQMRIEIPDRTSSYTVSQPVRGLICFMLRTKVAVYNPGMKRMVQDLPEIQGYDRGRDLLHFFLGYDVATNVFKVLCVTRPGYSEPSEKYQVYTVGSREESWRRIKCKRDHQPYTEGLFKGEALYYGAHDTNSNKSLVMCFNLRSETFSVIELPNQVNFFRRGWDLVNYYGKVALSIIDNQDNGVLSIWVRNAMGEWSREEDIVVSRWKETIETKRRFRFKGTVGTKELVFAPDAFDHESPYVVYYNTDSKNLRRFHIEVLDVPPRLTSDYVRVRTFLDHVDSAWLM